MAHSQIILSYLSILANVTNLNAEIYLLHTHKLCGIAKNYSGTNSEYLFEQIQY